MPNTPDPREFYAVTKLLLMPSLWRTPGLVAMEAMLNGIPVLASNRGGLAGDDRRRRLSVRHPGPLHAGDPRRAHGRGGRALGRDDHSPLGRRGRV